MSEEAKAIQEISKVAVKVMDISEKFGGFVAKFISGSLEEGMGIFEDKFKYMRWERQVRLIKRAEDFMKEVGMEKPIKPIPIKFAIPLFQAATLEDDDYLQDLWARLLVNSSNENNRVELCRTYIDILERLSPLEAKILVKIYSTPFNEMEHKGVFTVGLPEKVTIFSPEKFDEIKQYKFNDEKILFALANLSRLGCISPLKTIGGGEIFSVVNPTVLGKYLVESFTFKNSSNT